MSQYEYVMSGLGYTRLNANRINLGNTERMLEVVNHAFSLIDGFDYSGLFNAYTERSIAESGRFKHIPFKEMHVDSGGLQMALFGKTITEDIKNQIYQTQGKFGSVAMCFDNIPLYTEQIEGAGTSQRTRIDNKIFLTTEMKDRAIDTGRNVNNQLRAFKEMGSDCKVMMIAQGNQSQDFADFIRYQFDEIDDELKDGIHGIAVADTCIGNGILESIEMLSGFNLIDIPEQYKKNLHLLGVGSISRLMPVIELQRSGYLSESTHISFDSTTHSSSFIMGKMWDETGNFEKIGSVASNENLLLFEFIYKKYFEKFYDVPCDTFVTHVAKNLKGSKHLEDLSDLGEMRYLIQYIHSHECVIRFMDSVNRCVKSQNEYFKLISNQLMINCMIQLSKVEDQDDMNEYLKKFKPIIDSKRIARGSSIEEMKSATLDEFF